MTEQTITRRLVTIRIDQGKGRSARAMLTFNSVDELESVLFGETVPGDSRSLNPIDGQSWEEFLDRMDEALGRGAYAEPEPEEVDDFTVDL